MSLLKRIEQGQGTNSNNGQETADEAKSRLMALQARRVAPPGVSNQRDTL
jgi:hypothetical protein